MLGDAIRDSSTGTEGHDTNGGFSESTSHVKLLIIQCSCGHRRATHPFPLIAFASPGSGQNRNQTKAKLKYKHASQKWFENVRQKAKLADLHTWKAWVSMRFCNFLFQKGLKLVWRVCLCVSFIHTGNYWSPHWCWCRFLGSITSYLMPCHIQRCPVSLGWSRCIMRCCLTPFRLTGIIDLAPRCE